MTPRPKPKEKANMLVDTFESIIEQHCNQSSRAAHKSAAVECAINHAHMSSEQWDHFGFRDIANSDYWKHVEITLQEMKDKI